MVSWYSSIVLYFFLFRPGSRFMIGRSAHCIFCFSCFRNACAAFRAKNVPMRVFCLTSFVLFLNILKIAFVCFRRSCASVWYCVFPDSVARSYPFFSHISPSPFLRERERERERLGITVWVSSALFFHVFPVFRYPLSRLVLELDSVCRAVSFYQWGFCS